MKKFVALFAVLATLVSCHKDTVKLTGITFKGSGNYTIEQGKSLTLEYTLKPAGATADNLKWTSSKPDVASVDNDGKVAGLTPGKASITAESGKVSAKCIVTVAPSPTSLSLDKKTLTIQGLGKTEKLTPVFKPEGAYSEIEWTSSDGKVASVDAGVVKSEGPGKAQIKAKCNDLTAVCEVTVEVSAASVKLDKSKLELYAGGSDKITATLTPTNSTDKVTWSSSNESIATVSNGTVKAVSAGEVTITAKAASGAKAECSVTVYYKIPNGAVDLGLSVYWATCNYGGFDPTEFGHYVAWGEKLPYYSRKDPLTWKSGKTNGYSWDSYSMCKGDAHSLTKYCPANLSEYWGNASSSPDNKTDFKDYGYADDAARYGIGGTWRTPTVEEWKELKENCEMTYGTQKAPDGTAVEGLIVKSKVNGETIFLPSAGLWSWINVFLRNDGNYWASSTYKDQPDKANQFYFTGQRSSIVGTERCIGLTIRPVATKKAP